MFGTKPMTKVKDTTTSLQESEPGKDIAWNHPRRPAEAQARMKSASRSRTAQLVWPEGFTKPQASSEEPERQPRKGDNLYRAPGPQEITQTT